jgi:hypothetical protein
MRIESLGLTRVPIVATLPFTVTLPSWIHVSMSLREPSPAWASTLCSFCDGASTGGRCAAVRA